MPNQVDRAAVALVVQTEMMAVQEDRSQMVADLVAYRMVAGQEAYQSQEEAEDQVACQSHRAAEDQAAADHSPGDHLTNQSALSPVEKLQWQH